MRKVGRVLAAATLALVLSLTGIVVFAAWMIAPVRSLPEAATGFRLTGIRFENPRYEPGHLVFDRVEETVRVDGVRCEIRRSMVVDAESSGEAVPSRAALAARLLVAAELMPERAAYAASDAEFAFIVPSGILRRRGDGRWEVASGGAVPEPWASLGTNRRGSLETRLAHPDSLVWTDAALEACLRGEGAKAFADALLRSPGGTWRRILVRLLLDAGAPEEVARVVAGSNSDGMLQLRLLDELSRPPGVEEPRGRATALVLVTRHRWPARETSTYLRDWLVGSLEDGSFELLERVERRGVFERLAQVIDDSMRERLGRIVAERDGASCAAAYLLLRKREGEPTPELAGEAKRWWREGR